ncbi:MAG: hypothetical protein IJF59_04175 [Clostridia bacterium]|nr:hypothetical protein [Clostridia bacterium]
MKKLFKRRGEQPQAAPPQLPAAEAAAMDAAAAEEALREQLAAITALDPAVKDWRQVLTKPGAEQFHSLVAKGLSPVEAYKVVWFEELVGARVEQAMRTALGRGMGKRHLGTLPAAAGKDGEIPPEVMRQYRAFFPEWNEARILADYRKHR